jgi:hypothetical protein
MQLVGRLDNSELKKTFLKPKIKICTENVLVTEKNMSYINPFKVINDILLAKTF